MHNNITIVLPIMNSFTWKLKVKWTPINSCTSIHLGQWKCKQRAVLHFLKPVIVVWWFIFLSSMHWSQNSKSETHYPNINLNSNNHTTRLEQRAGHFGKKLPNLVEPKLPVPCSKKVHWTLSRDTSIQSTSPLYFSVIIRNPFILSIFTSNWYEYVSSFHFSLWYIFIPDWSYIYICVLYILTISSSLIWAAY